MLTGHARGAEPAPGRAARPLERQHGPGVPRGDPRRGRPRWESGSPGSSPKLDRRALGVAVGTVSGLLLFLATLILVLKRRPGRRARTLGCSVSTCRATRSRRRGSVLGLCYGLGVGFVAGWTFAFLRNAPSSSRGRPAPTRAAPSVQTLPRVHLGEHPWHATRRARRSGAGRDSAAECGDPRHRHRSHAGLGVFVATNWLISEGGPVVGPHLALLGQFFIGYRVTFVGSLVGFLWAFAVGFLVERPWCGSTTASPTCEVPRGWTADPTR